MTAKKICVRMAIAMPALSPLALYALPFKDIEEWAGALSEVQRCQKT